MQSGDLEINTSPADLLGRRVKTFSSQYLSCLSLRHQRPVNRVATFREIEHLPGFLREQGSS